MKFRFCIFFVVLISIVLGCTKDKVIMEDGDEGEKISFPEAPKFNCNRLFIKNGLQLGCWVGTSDLKKGQEVGQPHYKVNLDDWDQTGFTGPTFFGPPLFNKDYMEAKPNSQWSLAKAPYGQHLSRKPYDNEYRNGFLTVDQKNALSQLTTICFGDEEHYSVQVVNQLAEWYKVCRKFYPDAMVHNNQYGYYPGHWSADQMRNYIQTAKPDLITFDAYYFGSWRDVNFRGSRLMAMDLMNYRLLSLEGIDGTGAFPIAFGQYTQGYKQEGSYEISESQLRLYYSMTWAFGGKWLNWFRYLQGDDNGAGSQPTSWCMLLENGLPGHPSIYMDWVNKCNAESKRIGDFLVRLQTKDVRFLGGDQGVTDGKPSLVSNWNPNVDDFIVSIDAIGMEGPFKGKGADLYIGYYDIIPKSEKGDPSFFENTNAHYFMIVNGLTAHNIKYASDLMQQVEIVIDFSDHPGSKLVVVSKETGLESALLGEELGNGKIKYKINIVGGGFEFLALTK